MEFLILALATWRLSSLMVNEDGPFKMFEYVRQLPGPFECIWCFSVWVGIFLSISFITIPLYTTWFCMPFALSTVAILVDKFTD